MAKRFLDITLSLTSLIFLTPLLVVLAILIYLKLGRPILFTQTRPGLHGHPFKIYKFRSMLDAYDKTGAPLPDKDRLTSLGRILRSTSMDELPNLWTILKGDMSLVGPRPLLMEYLPLYNGEQAKRHLVKPGLTGWAQVNGRNAISWEDKFKLDVWYVEHQSFWLDMKIILLTIKKVFAREGISASGESTTTKFTGNT
jgi:sugar transferase EpsL